MRPRAAKRINRVLAVTAGLLLAATTTATAKADGYLSDAEAAYVHTFGASAICPTIAAYPSVPGVLGVAQAIIDDGWSPDSAADIVNAAVGQYCPRFWPLLVAIGNAARADQTAGYLV